MKKLVNTMIVVISAITAIANLVNQLIQLSNFFATLRDGFFLTIIISHVNYLSIARPTSPNYN